MNVRSIVGEFYLRFVCRFLKSPLRSRLVARWLYGPGLFPTNKVRYAMRGGMWMKLDLHDQVSRMIYFLGSHEPEETEFLKRIIQPDWVVIDVGAHIGYYTLLVARFIDRKLGHVYAFEPNPATFEVLRHHIKINNLAHVTVLNVALGASTGQIELFLGPSRNTGMASMFSRESGQEKVCTPITTLDRFVNTNNLKSIDLIKMDVEGAEVEVLEGARNVLGSYVPRLVLEVNAITLARSGHRPRDLVLLLRDYGYTLFRIDRPGAEITLNEIEASEFANVYCEPR
jgi:FkbM family methyltransferase